MFGPSVVWTVMLGAGLLGAAAALVGTFAVLRRRALVGDMLAHAALPGIVAVFMIMGSRELATLSAGALVAGLLGVGCLAIIARWTRTSEDAAIGIVLSTFFGAGIVLLTKIQSDPKGNKAGLDSYLFGEIASLQSRDLVVIAVTAAVVLVVVIAAYKELKVLSFDHEFAAVQGWPTFWLDLAVLSAVAVVTIIGLPICGVILMAAMLITPAAAARFWTNRLGWMLLVAAVLGALAGVSGCVLAAPRLMGGLGLGWLTSARGLPPGPLIVLAGAVLLIVSMVLAPEQGLVARWWREWQMRLRIARDHLLRAVYEASPSPEAERPWVERSKLEAFVSWGPVATKLRLWQAARRGLIEQAGERVRFTVTGYQTAARLVRAHRLWELYLVTDWQRPADRVHSEADAVEHLLPQEVIERLESILRAEHRLPETLVGAVPRSPHQLSHAPDDT